MTDVPLERSRVAELIVTRADGRQRGSGYRTSTNSVLTAAHVVDGATSVQVRFEPDLDGEWTVEATSWWADPVSDLAVVTIDAPGPVAPARFARIEDRAAVLTVMAVGFPWWKMRTDLNGKKYRDSHQVVGTVALLSNWREGTLEVVVDPATPRADHSPWEGMSGAVLWSDDRIVGVLAKHHPRDGLGRLAAARLDLALDRVDPRHGTPLRDALAVPAPLPSVLAPHRAIATPTYQALAAEAAPQHLHDRSWELGELVRFCAGDEPYQWWQAGPWAGKSALLAWFALHPPDGVDVVSFFITGRWVGQSDSDAFTEAVIEQLAALVGEPPEPALEARARAGHLLRLLGTAAEDRRLLLVVDGLDEDTSGSLDLPSIASLLPRQLPPNVRVLVASRPHPGLPADVPANHPLKTVRLRVLQVSPYARDLEHEAKRELSMLLRRPGLHRDLLGLVTASGGGLTRSDLEELTGQPGYELEALFGGVLGRSVGRRTSSHFDDRVYLFTHETLREQAERQYGKGIAVYRNRIHAWADEHRGLGWSAETPSYLFRGYPRMLAAQGETDRLVACALDRERHDRMLELTGGDALALSEIASAAGLLLRAPDPDLVALLRVATARAQLSERNLYIPAELPAAWARIGEVNRAIALASGLAVLARAEALTRIIEVLVEIGDTGRIPRLADEVERLAAQIEEPLAHHQRLVELALNLPTERARRLVSEVEETVPRLGDSYVRDGVLGLLIRAWAKLDGPESVLRHLADLGLERCEAGRDLPPAELVKGNEGFAWSYGQAVARSYQRNQALSDLAVESWRDFELTQRIRAAIDSSFYGFDLPRMLLDEALAAGEDDLALRYASESGELVVMTCDALLERDEPARSLRFAEAIDDAYVRGQKIVRIAAAHLDRGDVEETARLGQVVEELAAGLADPVERAVLRVMNGSAAPEFASLRAEVIAQPKSSARVEALIRLSGLALVTSDFDSAVHTLEFAADALDATPGADRDELERTIVEFAAGLGVVHLVLRLRRPGAAAEVLYGLLAAAEGERAAEIALVIAERVHNLSRSDVVEGLAELGEDDLVRALVAEGGNWFEKDNLLVSAAHVALTAGEDERALGFMAAVSTSGRRMEHCADLAEFLSYGAEFDRAERFARLVDDPERRGRTFAHLARAAAEHGEFDRSYGFLTEVVDATDRARGLTLLAAAGDRRHAADLCVEAEEAARQAVRERSSVPLDVLVALVDGGDGTWLERLTHGDFDENPLVGALLWLTRRALAAEDHERARVLALEAAAVHRGSVEWLEDVLDVLLRVGETERAGQLVADLEPVVTGCLDESERESFVAAIVAGLAGLGRHDEAVARLAEIDSADSRLTALTALARSGPGPALFDEVSGQIGAIAAAAVERRDSHAPWINLVAAGLAAIDDYDRALDLVRTSTALSDHVDVLQELARVAPDDADRRREVFAQLEALALGLADVHSRDQLLSAFVARQYQHGEHSEAERLAGLITDPGVREVAVRHMRLQAIEDGRETVGARKYVAEVLATDNWSDVLGAVASVDLGALQRFAELDLG